ncbi:hypothetical protein [Microbispora sp. NPDC049633]|uniref:hypothetical protein n=1 Tax=Microbispora sp. NPDC049633 TaxID=3154355 RepID=UPI00341AC8CA
MKRESERVHFSTTTETVFPYRLGKDVVIRFGQRGLVVGAWRDYAEDEDTAMALAIGARPDELFDEDGELAERFERHQMRRDVARHVRTLDDEWRIVNALDLLDEEEA